MLQTKPSKQNDFSLWLLHTEPSILRAIVLILPGANHWMTFRHRLCCFNLRANNERNIDRLRLLFTYIKPFRYRTAIDNVHNNSAVVLCANKTRKIQRIYTSGRFVCPIPVFHSWKSINSWHLSLLIGTPSISRDFLSQTTRWSTASFPLTTTAATQTSRNLLVKPGTKTSLPINYLANTHKQRNFSGFWDWTKTRSFLEIDIICSLSARQKKPLKIQRTAPCRLPYKN